MRMKNFLQKLNPFSKVRKYEGASRSKRLRLWKTDSTSANSEILGSLETLRNRSRDLRRNNPYAARAIQAISANTVGKGIQTQFRDSNETLSVTNNAEIDWKAWAHQRTFDFDGRYDIFGFQRMIMQGVPESGEILIRKRFVKGLAFPLQYQLLESDFLDSNKNVAKTETNNTIIQGIEFDKKGKIAAYWLFETHPGGYDEAWRGGKLTSNRIPADEIIHLLRQERPGQLRGVPWLTPVIIRIKDLDDFEDAQLMRQKIAACFTAFVQDISAEAMENNSSAETSDEVSVGERLEPGTVEFLPPGKTVTFANPPESPNYDSYVKAVLRSIAVGVGVSYEVLTGDLSSVNFSSARMGWIDFQRNLEIWRKEILINGFLEVVVSDFKMVSSILGKNYSSFTAAHTPPRREMLDPSTEISAIVSSVRAGLSNMSEELMALGKDPVEHLTQYKKDKDLISQLGLVLDSDPSKVMKAGIVQTYIGDADGNVEAKDTQGAINAKKKS